jgi:hypothetical protein
MMQPRLFHPIMPDASEPNQKTTSNGKNDKQGKTKTMAKETSLDYEPGVLRVFQSKDETKAFYNKIAKVYDLLAEHSEQPMREIGINMLAVQTGASRRAEWQGYRYRPFRKHVRCDARTDQGRRRRSSSTTLR